MFAKTQTFEDHDIANRIVQRLGEPDEEEMQRLINVGVLNLSHADLQGVNFLESAQQGVFNTTFLSERLFD